MRPRTNAIHRAGAWLVFWVIFSAALFDSKDYSGPLAGVIVTLICMKLVGLIAEAVDISG